MSNLSFTRYETPPATRLSAIIIDYESNRLEWIRPEHKPLTAVYTDLGLGPGLWKLAKELSHQRLGLKTSGLYTRPRAYLGPKIESHALSSIQWFLLVVKQALYTKRSYKPNIWKHFKKPRLGKGWSQVTTMAKGKGWRKDGRQPAIQLSSKQSPSTTNSQGTFSTSIFVSSRWLTAFFQLLQVRLEKCIGALKVICIEIFLLSGNQKVGIRFLTNLPMTCCCLNSFHHDFAIQKHLIKQVAFRGCSRLT